MKKIGIFIAAIVGAVFVYTMLTLPTAPPAPAPPPPPTEVEKCGPGCNSGHAYGRFNNKGVWGGENGSGGDDIPEERDEQAGGGAGEDQDPGNSGNQSQGGKNF